MPSVPPAERLFSPLDEELQLVPGSLSPSLVNSLIRMGSWMPFEPAAKMVSRFTKVDISEATARRVTEGAGEAYVEVQSAQVKVLEKDLPHPSAEGPEGAAVQQVSVDGAMVPLVGKEWAEVKTLAIGVVGEPVLEKGEWVVHTHELSYFSRLADHETFARLATVEMYRRGVENAGLVCAVVDGADWEQGFIDLHCPNAVRILDWAHAAEHLARAGQAVFGVGTVATCQWLEAQLHELKHGDSQKVLGKLRGLGDELAAGGVGCEETLKVVRASLEYLEKRQEQIRYAEFLAAGYPIGSGIVESANKLVVEERLKGAGMHWARANVNPMVALRTIACSDRWEEAWPQIRERLRQQAKEGSASRRAKRRRAEEASREHATAVPPKAKPKPKAMSVPRAKDELTSVQEKVSHAPRKPAPNHPWRHMPIGRRRFPSALPTPSTKL